jgi:hypothetical protein
MSHPRRIACEFDPGIRAGQRSKGGLSEADSTIIGGNIVICPNFQTFRVQKTLDVVQEQLILKNASRKHDGVDCLSAAQSRNGFA